MTDWTRLNFIVEGRCVTTGRKGGRVFRGGMPNYSFVGWAECFF